ncbi:transcriptional regulator EutR [Thalassoglobus neptunius]|uniref:Transcriptional regulator EutR n=1 Tax=Thalassoglobus neptunius TaxID=1938619 RepID=A0A5C5VUV8_9PLAN|nr:helix-turn-helix domain-containing protein [Thalassoglobus neptunius]TWT42428.1 transcriptional regulator EutR [Thalassoglobus neptunius]
MGDRVGIDDMIVQRQGKDAEYLSGSLWDSVVFVIPEVHLCEQIANLTQRDPQEVLSTHGVVHLDPHLASQIRKTSLAYLRAMRQLPSNSCDELLIGNLAQSAITLVAQGLASSHVANHSQATLQRRNELVRKAKDFAADRPDQPLWIRELCRELAVSERTLRHAFCNVTGMSPLDYLKIIRLNRVKRQLREAVVGDVLVKQLAIANGFTHLGQFSRDYKQFFGELPSHTLNRQ